MSTEVLVGLIGLGGALVGAAAAFSGVVYQQRHQAKLAREQRRTAMSDAAVNTLITELEKLRTIAWRRPLEEDHGDDQWHNELGDCIDRIRLAALRLPHQELRETIEAACTMAFGEQAEAQDAVGLRAPRLLMMAAAVEAQRCLGAYLRGEPLPTMRFLPPMRRRLEEMTDPRLIR